MKVLIGTDLEGVAGVVDFETQAYGNGKYHEQAKVLLTREINAAVDGLLEAGVEDILVIDGHGPGGVSFEHLHPRAKLLHGRPPAPQHAYDTVAREHDVCIMLGQHAMAGVEDGNLNHTQDSRAVDSYTLNGNPIGEIVQFALYHGALGLPLIWLTGDEAACREARDLIPDITTTAVKKGLSRLCAISLSAEVSRELIRKDAIKAVENHKRNPIPPLTWPGPYVLEKRFFHSHSKDAYVNHPMAEIVDSQTVRLRSENILDILYA
ncbi:MAG: M55 family metallopeptidase [Phycisphaerae bacterium]|nr:M55 family metallopeptidase [Phycisphaerae bacterium]